MMLRAIVYDDLRQMVNNKDFGNNDDDDDVGLRRLV